MMHLRLANRLLAALPDDNFSRLVPNLHIRHLNTGAVLFDIGQATTSAYFPAGAVISLGVTMPGGQAAEAATIGCEGVVGAITALIGHAAVSRCTVQIPGPAIRIDSRVLGNARATMPVLDQLLHRYTVALLAQAFQSVACNLLHPVEARLARWLLTTADRCCDDRTIVHLTQEAIATMLGSHRVSVAQVLATLEAEGMIERGRGVVRLINRPALEARACACYAAVQEQYDRLLPARDSEGASMARCDAAAVSRSRMA